MGTEIINRDADEFSIMFMDEARDGMSTDFGVVHGITKITLGHGETSFTEGSLYIHIDGDATKVGISELSFNSTFVTAYAFAELSAGLMRSGCDAQTGDGEIVLIVLMDSDMPDSTLARAGITATEAITAAVQDLGLAYGGEPASGSVRQTIVTVRSKESGMFLRGAGKHTKLGELIGRSTIEAVKASSSENGLTIANRASLMEMMNGYGYDQDRLHTLSGSEDYSLFLVKVLDKDSDPRAVATVSAALHIYNESRWGLVDNGTATEVVIGLLRIGLREPVRCDGILETIAKNVAMYFVDP